MSFYGEGNQGIRAGTNSEKVLIRSYGRFRNGLRRVRELTHPYRNILFAASLIILTIGVYFPALDSRMVADDFIIVNNWGLDEALRSLHDTVGFGRNEFRPVIAFSYALSNSIWQGALPGYHLDSILLHTINVLLLFFWLLLLTRSPGISVMAAALFAVHPIHDERVIWITARDSLFSTLFSLLTFITYTLARRPNHSESTHPSSSAKILISLSACFFILSLLSYEGAAVVPLIIAALEFFIFAQPKQVFWRRLWTAIVKTRWYMIILLIYLMWWALLFQMKVGSYNLSLALGNLLLDYYCYLYQLFHGNSRLAGIIYFVLILSIFLLPRERRPIAGFSFIFIIIAFFPFMITAGFADRFAYAGALGYATLIALLIYSCAMVKKEGSGRSFQIYRRPLALLIFLILIGYYIRDLRLRNSDWLAAGQIAETIPRKIKTLYPDLPDGTYLVLARTPTMHGHAYVYPIGLDYSIKRFYPGREIQVLYGPGEINEILERSNLKSSSALFFNYLPDSRSIEEIFFSKSEALSYLDDFK